MGEPTARLRGGESSTPSPAATASPEPTTTADRRPAEWTLEQYRLVVDAIDEGIVLYDRGGRILAVNRAAERLLGVRFDDMFGHAYEGDPGYQVTREDGSVVAPEDVCVGRALRSGQPEVDEVLGIPDRGGARWVRIDARPLATSGPLAGLAPPDSVVSVITDITLRVETMQALRASEAAYRLMADHSTDIIGRFDLEGRVRYLSPAVRQVLGYLPDELIGVRYFDGLHPEGRDEAAAIYHASVESRRPTAVTARWLHKDGHAVWLETTVVIVRDPSTGEPVEIQTSARDVTARQEAHAALKDSERRWRVALDHAPIGIALCRPDGAIEVVNAKLAELLGYTADELYGTDFLEITHPDDVDATLRSRQRLLDGESDTYELEKRYLTRDGAELWARVTTTALLLDDGRPYQALVLVEDITETRRARELLEHRVLHDSLTELPNRVLLMDRLDQALRRCAQQGRPAGVLFADLDRFKTVNASVGQQRGDEVLATVAARFAAAVHLTDTLARLSGDEFVVVCEHVTSARELAELAERLSAVTREPLSIAGRQSAISVSIGATLAPKDLLMPASLVLDEAESALVVAKRTGRARWELYDPALRSVSHVDRLWMEGELRAALARDELRLYYQPIVELCGRRVVGYEALIRWQHPVRGLLGPAEFLPMAEDSTLMGPIGAWVLDTAACTAARWVARDGVQPWVSVNVSGQQLGRPEMVPSVQHALEISGLPPERLKVEVTETALFAGVENAIADLHQIAALGVRTALDDFGTGYSSFTLLRDVPATMLKLDRSFVAGIGSDAGSAAIVEAVVALGRALGLSIVAEGVETVEQASALERFGCPLGQGYLFGRPAPDV